MQTEPTFPPASGLREHVPGFAAVALILWLTGPFGTYDLAPGFRALYWTACLAAGWIPVVAMIRLFRYLPILAAWTPLRRIALAMLAATGPAAILVIWTDATLRSGHNRVSPWLIAADVAVLGALIGGLFLARRLRARPPAGTAPALPDSNAFLQRLPPDLGTALISVSSQDHYVEAVTTTGHTLIHMRFADALAELADYPGQQIHRSHWISTLAFTGLTRDGERLLAHLSDGRQLPVSRSFAASARAMTPMRPVPGTGP